MTVQSDVAGLPSTDRNNLIYMPIMSALLRLEDSNSWQKDEIDAVYLNMKPDADVVTAGAVVRGLLDVSHRGATDFSGCIHRVYVGNEGLRGTEIPSASSGHKQVSGRGGEPVSFLGGMRGGARIRLPQSRSQAAAQEFLNEKPGSQPKLDAVDEAVEIYARRSIAEPIGARLWWCG